MKDFGKRFVKLMHAGIGLGDEAGNIFKITFVSLLLELVAQ
jgi:hypothetical protein